MITRQQKIEAQERAAEMIREAGIHITEEEISRIEVVDFGLSNLEQEGIQVYNMVNTDRLAAKVLVLFPDQTEPEHCIPEWEMTRENRKRFAISGAIFAFTLMGLIPCGKVLLSRGKRLFTHYETSLF